jgi:uncharacterized membrane protein YkgB
MVADGSKSVPVAAPHSVPGRAFIARIFPWLETVQKTADRAVTRMGLPLLRVSLGVIFLWFGALKLTNSTPVARLVADTVPFLPAKWFVPGLGLLEVVLGVGLLLRRWIPAVVTIMVAHLTGTFLVLVTQPEVAFQHGNPLMLTMTGEFVVKNLILISAGLVLVAFRPAASRK